MSALKKIYYHTASLLPMRMFRSGGPNHVLLPYHHLVSNKDVAHIQRLYSYKNEKVFTDDLDFLLKNYTPVHPDALYNAVHTGQSIPKGSFLLTFDDGLREVYDIIAPLLHKKGIPAIFFINPAFIDNKELFYRCKISLLIHELKQHNALRPLYAGVLKVPVNEKNIVHTLCSIDQCNAHLLDDIAAKTGYSFREYLEKQQPFLNREQLIALHRQGFTIGAHSMDHPYYKLLPEEEQVRQTIDSCRYVKELTGQTICHFSFPHSDADVPKKVVDAIRQQNEGLLFGIQNQKQELQNNILHRFNAERPEIPFEKLIKGQLLLNRLLQLAGRNIVNRT